MRKFRKVSQFSFFPCLPGVDSVYDGDLELLFVHRELLIRPSNTLWQILWNYLEIMNGTKMVLIAFTHTSAVVRLRILLRCERWRMWREDLRKIPISETTAKQYSFKKYFPEMQLNRPKINSGRTKRLICSLPKVYFSSVFSRSGKYFPKWSLSVIVLIWFEVDSEGNSLMFRNFRVRTNQADRFNFIEDCPDILPELIIILSIYHFENGVFMLTLTEFVHF